MKAQLSTARAGWETPIFSPLLSDTPSDHLLRYTNPALHRVRAALVNVNPADADADAQRAALRREICLASGVDPKDICPVMGYNLSADAFRKARDSWVEHLQAHRPSDWTYAEHNRARAFWAKARPDLIGDWPEVER